MKRFTTAAIAGGALLVAVGAHAQTVTSTNGSYTVSFTESAANLGGGLFEYTYDATLVAPTNGAYVNNLAFDFTNPSAVIPFTANSDSFTAVSQTGNSIDFAVAPGDPTAGIPADAGLSAANPTAIFTFDSMFAPSTTGDTLAITPAGGNNAGVSGGVGSNGFVGPTATPEPGALATLSLGAFGLIGLAVRARRAVVRS